MTTKAIVQKWSKTVVSIKTDRSQGTGFFDKDGLLYTAYHVLQGSESASFTFADGRKGTIIAAFATDPTRDLAVLITDSPVTGPSLGDFAALSPGDRVTVIGSPLGLSQTVTEGIVSAKRTSDSMDYLQLSAGVSHGSSGSPVFNDKGNVVGLVVSTLSDGQQLNFALSSKDIKKVFGVPLKNAFSTVASSANTPAVSPPVGSNVGLILSEPGRSADEGDLLAKGASNYVKLSPLSISADVDDDVKDSISSTDLERFATNLLTDAGVPIQKDRNSLLGKKISSEMDELKRTDEYYSGLLISIDAIKTEPEQQTIYTISIAFSRAGFIYPGKLIPVVVDRFGKFGIFGRSREPGTVIRDATRDLLGEFIERYKYANPKKQDGS